MNKPKSLTTNPSLPVNEIINGNNVKIMQSLPEKSIDLIFADPPYFMNCEKDLIRYEGTKFDGVDDDWDKYDDLVAYDTECKQWLGECLRILKDNGSLWAIGSFQNIHRLGYLLQDMGAWIINEIVWEKTNPVPNFNGTRFVNAQETMLWVVKNKKAKFTFNYKTMKHLNGGTQMKSVWKLPICTGNERLKDIQGHKAHNTQKPLELLKRIVLACSKPGDVVLDPFSGTGTTAHATKLLGRKYIGIELDPTYCQISKDILAHVVEDTTHDDLKFATYDIAPEKVTFKDLLDAHFLSPEDDLYLNDILLHFNPNGTITYQGIEKSPNALCKEYFGKPTNAWDAIKLNQQPLSVIRQQYRLSKQKKN